MINDNEQVQFASTVKGKDTYQLFAKGKNVVSQNFLNICDYSKEIHQIRSSLTKPSFDRQVKVIL